MQALNHSLFLWINASNPSEAALLFGLFAAKWLVWLYPLFLLLAWGRAAESQRAALLQAVLCAVIAMILSWLIARLWPQPRPFVLELGQQHLAHRANASFPSNHLSFIWAICVGLALAPAYRRAALALAVLGLPVAWARIFLGVHFPLDMLGAFFTAIAAGVLSLPLRARVAPMLVRLLQPVYRFVCAWPIKRGWLLA